VATNSSALVSFPNLEIVMTFARLFLSGLGLVLAFGWSPADAQLPLDKNCLPEPVRDACSSYFTVCTTWLQPCFTCEPDAGATRWSCVPQENAICTTFYTPPASINCGTKYRGYCYPDGSSFTCHAGSTGEACAQTTYSDC